MSFDFLKDYEAHRVPSPSVFPLFFSDDMREHLPSEEKKDLGYECEPQDWHAIDIFTQEPPPDWPWRPQRFLTGHDMGRTIAWVQADTGHQVPVRLAEVGAVAVVDRQGRVCRANEVVQRLLSLNVQPFCWEDVERFAIALQGQRIRLVASHPESLSFRFEEMCRVTQQVTRHEMHVLEKQMLAIAPTTPTIVDGRLAPYVDGFDLSTDPVVGFIRSSEQTFLDAPEVRLLRELRPGQRTPAFRLDGKTGLISWYVCMHELQAAMPDWGCVRLEVAPHFLQDRLREDRSYLNFLSYVVYTYHCCASTESRAPVSLYPIERAKESLRSLFTSPETLIHHFYRLNNL